MIIIMLVAVLSVGTFAYSTWRSKDGGRIITKIGDIALINFDNGINISGDRLTPVLNYEDGILVDFNIKKTIDDSIAIRIYLTINELSDELKCDAIKFLILNSDDDKEYKIINQGNLSEFDDNSLDIISSLVLDNTNSYFKLYVYMDGNMNNVDMEDKVLDLNLNVDASSELDVFTKDISDSLVGGTVDVNEKSSFNENNLEE